MSRWLVSYDYGDQEIVEAEDFWELHEKVDCDRVDAVMKIKIQDGDGDG